MTRKLDVVLRGLDEACAFAKSFRFEMSDEYRALIAQVEALPRNQPGADKSGRWLGSRAGQRALLAQVRLVPRTP